MDKAAQRHAVKKSKHQQRRPKLDSNVYQVFRDVNGIAYLRVAMTPNGAQFVVNKAFSVELVDIDANSTYGHHLAMRPVPNASIVESAKRLLHPLNDQCTISQRAKEHLIQILSSKELQMKATAATARPVSNKFATVTAPPAKNAKAAKPSKAAVKPNGAAATSKAPAQRNNDEVYQSKVVATNKEAREGSFFHHVVTLAKKPIVLETLIGHVLKAVGKSLKSDKDPAVVVRTRTRDSIKLGFLKQVK